MQNPPGLEWVLDPMTGILERVRPREIRQLEEETEEKNHIKTDTDCIYAAAS